MNRGFDDHSGFMYPQYAHAQYAAARPYTFEHLGQPPPSLGFPTEPDRWVTAIELEMRQQPAEALVTVPGKEKARKPVDPPPIIQLKVDKNGDPGQHFLQSPYLFTCATLCNEKGEPIQREQKEQLVGSLVSSLHRLKDVNNADGGFFVFGDISVRVTGTHRLMFSLFSYSKQTESVHFLKSIHSEPFKVVTQKHFKGLEESTYLSRAFSDQGVRLRLRKEPRAMMAGGTHKRGYQYALAPEADADSRPPPTNSGEDGYGNQNNQTHGDYVPSKRFKADNPGPIPVHPPDVYRQPWSYGSEYQTQAVDRSMPYLGTTPSSSSVTSPMSQGLPLASLTSSSQPLPLNSSSQQLTQMGFSSGPPVSSDPNQDNNYLAPFM
ncbi:velvet factor-domain-containing protein [Lineolata rhizophorae]|uniref:Velvet factor-domain-containing protein n=1 Tax=Lineolata rhizophorae TaxID=578093 RepID=A0A6A6P9V7_9PEZI|nr:velvet factor-domain-containing protein [Lineolata rhizophorae]